MGSSFMTEDSEQTQDSESELDIKKSMEMGGTSMINSGNPDAKLTDFNIKKMIGRGTFGKVYIVENKNDEKLYAMKCIRKDLVLENQQIENINLEKNILHSNNHPFLVRMEYVFQNEFRIYFIMQFVKGGELFKHLVQVKRFNEEQAKFFAAQVALGLG